VNWNPSEEQKGLVGKEYLGRLPHLTKSFEDLVYQSVISR